MTFAFSRSADAFLQSDARLAFFRYDLFIQLEVLLERFRLHTLAQGYKWLCHALGFEPATSEAQTQLTRRCTAPRGGGGSHRASERRFSPPPVADDGDAACRTARVRAETRV